MFVQYLSFLTINSETNEFSETLSFDLTVGLKWKGVGPLPDCLWPFSPPRQEVSELQSAETHVVTVGIRRTSPCTPLVPSGDLTS